MVHLGVDPFEVPVEDRDPARRFRGRLASTVTVWTTNGEESPVGITVGSIVVAEGQPPAVVALIDPLSLFWDAVVVSRTFVVHVLEQQHRRLADQMAGRYPGPDARFENVPLEPSPWGPVITTAATRAYCTLRDSIEVGESLVVTGDIDELELSDITHPLVSFRGDYRGLDGRD